MVKRKHKRKIILDMARLLLVFVLTIVFILVDIKFIQTGAGFGANKGVSYASELSMAISEVVNNVAGLLEGMTVTETAPEVLVETVNLNGANTEPAVSVDVSTVGVGVADVVMAGQDIFVPEAAVDNIVVEAETVSEIPEKLEFTQAPEGYFNDVLFIGDSRTVGLYEYGGIEGADFFATTGMSVFSALYETVEVGDKGSMAGIESLLANYSYGKIYVMLGINELGYPVEEFEEGYTSLLDKIRKAQPEAVIFVQANQHVSEARSKNDEIYNNQNINRLNEFIQTFADDKDIFYIDVNVLFDDENGNLKADLTKDGTHVQGKYYREWAEWLGTKAIVK